MTDDECGSTTLCSAGEENDKSDECSQQQDADDDDDDDGDEDDDDDRRENVVLANDDDGESIRDDATPQQPRKVHKLSMKKTNDFNDTLKQRGVIYVARIPPRMTPTKLKTMLSDFGVVTRVFCQEEDAAKRKRRRKENGGTSGSKRYVEGWVEYANKQVARRVASALHQQPMSNVKRNPHHDDLWNLKYLSKFSWSHLTEKVAYERRVREQKLRLETMQAKRETASYKKLLETGVKLDQIEERKRKRSMGVVASAITTNSNPGGMIKSGNDRGRTSFQVKPLDDGAHQASNKAILKSLL